MATRIGQHASSWKKKVAGLRYYPSREFVPAPAAANPSIPGTIAILSAGTAWLPVAEEAYFCNRAGFRVQRLWDVGVAGIHRLLSNRHVIAEAMTQGNVMAGMEGRRIVVAGPQLIVQ